MATRGCSSAWPSREGSQADIVGGMATYIARKKLLERKERFPFTLMLEPLELCNLACVGCGRIQEYKDVFHKRLSVEECLRVADECGAPIVNIPWAITPGSPTAVAKRSFQWIGLKSPLSRAKA